MTSQCRPRKHLWPVQSCIHMAKALPGACMGAAIEGRIVIGMPGGCMHNENSASSCSYFERLHLQESGAAHQGKLPTTTSAVGHTPSWDHWPAGYLIDAFWSMTV